MLFLSKWWVTVLTLKQHTPSKPNLINLGSLWDINKPNLHMLQRRVFLNVLLMSAYPYLLADYPSTSLKLTWANSIDTYTHFTAVFPSLILFIMRTFVITIISCTEKKKEKGLVLKCTMVLWYILQCLQYKYILLESTYSVFSFDQVSKQILMLFADCTEAA